MTVTIDKVGRIILPKPLRDRLGLQAGAALEVEEIEAGLVLKPVSEKPSMIKVNGFWVHQGVLPEEFNWSRAVDDDREERMRILAGL